MAGKLQIYNKAIHRTGDATVVVSESDKSTPKILCDDNFQDALEELFIIHPFNCSLKNVLLTKTEKPGITGYKYGFELPADYVAALRLDGRIPYKIQGTFLYTNTEKPVLEYSGRITDLSVLNALIVECLVLLLASKIAFPLTQDTNLGDKLTAQFEEIALPAAKANDLKEKNSGRPKKYGWATGIVQSSDMIHGE